ncbi:MAG: TonB-dependent receptor plug domain-containing protein, partial [Planctomycetota bacterium]
MKNTLHLAWAFSLSCFAGTMPLSGQEKTSAIPLGETVVVTATRTSRDPMQIPFDTRTIGGHDLKSRRMARNLPEALKEEGVMIQKTSNGQGSPYIRGFTGFRTLLMVDGIRLNNSTFREGPNQYWSTVDPLSIERLELVKGPASVMHGSDAVGGAVNALTLDPYPGDFGGRLYVRGSTAERSHIERVEASGRMGNHAVVAGYSSKHYGDVRGGEGAGRQRATGYTEPYDHDVKLVSGLGEHAELTLAHQSVYQKDVWRTHTTLYGERFHGSTVGSDLYRILDQKRDLTYARLTVFEPTQAVKEASLTVSYQNQDETQNRFRSNGRLEYTDTFVNTWGIQGMMSHEMGSHVLTWGFDQFRDDVDSHFVQWDTGAHSTKRPGVSLIRPRGPVADNATSVLSGVYVQDEWTRGDLRVVAGARYTKAHAASSKVDENTFDATPYGRVSRTWEHGDGSLKALYAMSPSWSAWTGLSQAFRAPNLSDLTRFDVARTNEIQTPTPRLDPEEFLTAEGGFRGHGDLGEVEAVYFHTWINDMVIRRPTGIIVSGSNEVQADNSGEGFVEGVELKSKVPLTERLSTFGSFQWMRGRLEEYTSHNPQSLDRGHMSRIAPKNGSLGLRWEQEGSWWAEGFGTITRPQKRLSYGDSRDTERVPPGGTPGYNLYTVRGGWNILENL